METRLTLPTGIGRTLYLAATCVVVALAGGHADAARPDGAQTDDRPAASIAEMDDHGAVALTGSGSAAMKLTTGVVRGVTSQEWTPVDLGQAYDSMVVIASPVYDADSPPQVIRVRESSPSRFELKMDRVDGGTGSAAAVDVHYLVVEAGVYTAEQHGATMEAVRFTSATVSRASLWSGEARTYANRYSAPAVVGQVMSNNDPRPSVFFSHGPWTFTPAGPDNLVVGRHIGEDPDQDRLAETICYVVIESGSYHLDGLFLEAGVGDDTVAGIDAGPYSYALGGLGPVSHAVVSRSGIDGRDGGWAVLSAAAPPGASTLWLAIDEDQLADTERVHTTEQVAYIATGILPPAANGCGADLPATGVRDDVLIVVNRNSRSSCEVAEYYAAARGLGRDSLVEVAVPAAYFIDWAGFRSLRDQIIAHLGGYTLTDAQVTVAPCTDGDGPWYCEQAVATIREFTRIRYVVTTRGVPTRMTVDGSSLAYPSATSVDNYLRHWLVNYFADDEAFYFPQRAIDAGDGRGLRVADPAIDRELVVGRIDGVTAGAARALVERTIDAEQAGVFGKLFGSKFDTFGGVGTWNRYDLGAMTPIVGDTSTGWRIQSLLWGESRAECRDYLGHPHNSSSGKTPAHCLAQITDGSDPGPSHPGSRQPTVAESLVYLGSKDNSRSATGDFNDLLEWVREADCAIRLCEDAQDPAACRAASADPYGEINTDCVGVANGFVGFNLQSYPLSYLTAWPTGWRGPSGGSHDNLAFPDVRDDMGYDDNFSVWFRTTDEVDEPLCYTGSDFSGEPGGTCVSERRMYFRQILDMPEQTVEAASPQHYRLSLQYRSEGLTAATDLKARLRIANDAGEVVYGPVTLATAAPGDAGWLYAETTFVLDPARHTGDMAGFDRVTLQLQSDMFSGAIGIDDVALQDQGAGSQLAVNGDFSGGHRSLSEGDYAATFLSRLNGAAMFGSVSHHETSGYSFSEHPVTTLAYFLRGLPLGDAVWFAEFHNSGILYGDPLYSPVAVKLDYFNPWDYVTGNVRISGRAINGRDAARVTTSFTVDYCSGNDFVACDEAGAWQPTGVAGPGGEGELGSWDTTGLPRGTYSLRLAVTSVSLDNGKTQSFHDYQDVILYDALADDDGDGLPNEAELELHALDPTDPDMDDDGLPDGGEIEHGLDPLDPDTDDDGMHDGYEVAYGLNPLGDDSATDGDSDGLSNLAEFGYGTDPTTADTDGDGLADVLELMWLGSDPTLADTDADGLDDRVELVLSGTDPLNADSDGDAMPDGWEWTYGLDPRARDARSDTDADTVDNVVEFLRGSDPTDATSTPALAVWFVDAAATGAGDGSAGSPYASLAEALNFAGTGDTVILAPGRYAQGRAVNLAAGLRLEGSAPGVILEPTSLVVSDVAWGGLVDVAVETWANVTVERTRNWLFQGVTLASGYGIELVDSSNATFVNAGLVTWGAIVGLTLDGGSDAELVNVTVAGYGVGLKLADEASAVVVRNSILANSIDFDGDAANAQVRYTLVSDGQFAGANGNVGGHPSFRGEWWGDYRLQAESAGIDSGDPADDYSSEPSPNGCRINMGQFGNTPSAAASTPGC